MLNLIGQVEREKVQIYIPVNIASKLFGYNQQYLRQLLRQEKLMGIKVGQVWLIEVPSLENYLFLWTQRQDRRCGPRT
jgi:hypothetical protein